MLLSSPQHVCWGWDPLGWGLWGDAHPSMHILGQIVLTRDKPSPPTPGVSPLCACPRARHPPWRQAGPGGVHVPSVVGTSVHPPVPLPTHSARHMGAPKGHCEAMLPTQVDTPKLASL